MWVDQGKSKEGLCYDEMKNAKYKYKLAIREMLLVTLKTGTVMICFMSHG